MKKNEVPQDNADMLEGKFQEPCYAVDEDGKYITVPSVGWEAKNVVMQQAWDHIRKRVKEVKRKVDEGKLSPLAYHMEKQQMDPKLLGSYVGLKKKKVKKHLKPSGFDDLSPEMLASYARALNISVDELKCTDE